MKLYYMYDIKAKKKKKPLYIQTLTNQRFILFLTIIISLILLIQWISYPSSKGLSIDYFKVDFLTASEKKALKKYPNSYHLEIAKKKGIKRPFRSKEELLNNSSFYINTYNLDKINDNKYYELSGLIYSLPYLKKDAKEFLDDLGRQFQSTLNKNGLRIYRFSISSVLRTLDDQKDLRKTNVNATDNNSSHYYGRTFDLSQTRFFEQGVSDPIYSYRLRNLLLRELLKMQEEGRCYVLLENQTKCIHVTVR